MIIAIDGACRKPGTPECFSVGAYIAKDKDSNKIHEHGAVYELQSTGQRGEILALLQALEVCINSDEELIYVITDSEYIVNCVNKEWYKNWENKGWITAEGEEVKNKDLWEIASDMLSALEDKEIVIYHIKGHVFPFGKVTAKKLIESDTSLQALYDAVAEKFNVEYPKRQKELDLACALFEKNNGISIEKDSEALRELIIGNVMADLIAGAYADAVNNLGLVN
jgi:ribonuclease HI